MPESFETLSHYGLLYRLLHEIAELEGKRVNNRWVGADRNYVLDLVRDAVQAVDGTRGRPENVRAADTRR